MAVSIASNIDEKSINFDNSNMLDKGSWVVTKGKATFGDVITLGVGAEVKLVLNYTRNNNVVGQYIKMVCNASSTDKSLSTVEAHNLSMNLILKQVDNKLYDDKLMILHNMFLLSLNLFLHQCLYDKASL